MSTAFLYAGQGSQKVGMGQDFYEKYETFREFLDSLELSFDLKKMMFEDMDGKLSQTRYTQPCMAAFAAGVTKLLFEHGITPDETMGLSLGEYGALYCAGVFDAKTYVKITEFRGAAMEEAAKNLSCEMSAILGVKSEEIEKVIENDTSEGYVTISNYNCPEQYVICGDRSAVESVETILKERFNNRCIRLNVSGPFHTKYMKPAGEKLEEFFEQIKFNKPVIPVAMNTTGTYLKKEEDIKKLLVRQVQSAIRIEEDLKNMIEQGTHNFIEIGPGNVLAGFVKKTARKLGTKVTVTSISNVEDMEKLLKSQV